MCVLFVSFGSKVRPRTFGCVAMGSSSSGCLTGSWSDWSHDAVTPHSTIYHLVFVT